MKAVCWQGKNRVGVEDVPDPKLLNPRDAIVKITSTAICGSDLHLYNGYIPTMYSGDIIGHEFMGEIVDVGHAVTNRKFGDRVVCISIACGELLLLPAASSSRCVRTRTRTLEMAEKLGYSGCWHVRLFAHAGVAMPAGKPSTPAFRSPMWALVVPIELYR